MAPDPTTPPVTSPNGGVPGLLVPTPQGGRMPPVAPVLPSSVGLPGLLVPPAPPSHAAPELKVNPDMLRELAGTLDSVREAVKALKPDVAVEGPVKSLPGSDTARACADLSAEIKMHLDSFAAHMGAMATSARGGANNFDVAEADFAAQLAALGPPK